MSATAIIKVGDTVMAQAMPKDSHYIKVLGRVARINNGFATINTEAVKSRYSQEWKAHECAVGARIEDLIAA